MWERAMEDKVIKRALIVLATLFAVFVVIQLYSFYEKRNKNTRIIGEVMLYTKAGCRYCSLATSLLDRLSIVYDSEDISNNPTLQQKLINDTGQYTVPYVFIRGEFIGGYTELAQMNNNGDLLKIAIEIQGKEEE